MQLKQLEMLESDDLPPDEQVSGIIDGERWRGWLKNAMTELNDRENRIIKARRLTEEGATLEELGAELGISKERVRQIEGQSLRRLRLSALSAAHIGNHRGRTHPRQHRIDKHQHKHGADADGNQQRHQPCRHR